MASLDQLIHFLRGEIALDGESGSSKLVVVVLTLHEVILFVNVSLMSHRQA